MGDLLAVLVYPLAGHHYHHPSQRVDVTQPGLGLKIGVLLCAGTVGVLDYHVGARKARLHIAGANVVLQQDVVVAVAMDQRAARLHGGQRITDHRQILEVDL